jgi:16S rRNA processing protein RimM
VSPRPAAIAVGRVSAAHALGGLLRVRPFNADGDTFVPGRRVFLKGSNDHDGAWQEARIVTAAAHGRSDLLVRLEGIDDRTAAEALRGATILVDPDDLPPLEEDEFYHHEIVGFRVETDAGEVLGEVVETMSTGLNDVWVVQGGAREYLIPVIDDVVREIDRPGRRIVIAPMPGLLE